MPRSLRAARAAPRPSLPVAAAAASLATAGVVVAGALAGEHRRSEPPFEPMLFMDMNDTRDPWGLVYPVASTVAAADPAALSPPPLNYSAGCVVVAVLASQGIAGEFEVYAVNTTGFEPVDVTEPEAESLPPSTSSSPPVPPRRGSAEGDQRPEKRGTAPRPGVRQEYGKATVLRFTTSDFRTYAAPRAVLHINWAGTPTVKSIARSPGGRYVMFCYLSANPVEPDPTQRAGAATYVSTDAGVTWARTNATGIAPQDKDDLNIIWSGGRYVDMQIVWQPWRLRYCDNGGCDRRRTVSAKTSPDGVAWGPDRPLITPDGDDPPELEFYRIRPFYIGNTSRIAAHTLQYAPAPSLDLLGWSYGRQPTACANGNGSTCHGPHLYEEWWVGPASGDPADTLRWRRPYRRTRAAPRDAFLMAQPVPFGDELVWVGSTGRVYTLPMYRIAGIYAPANGEFSTPAFTAPHDALWVNADVHWEGRLVTGGCDEGCAAYLYAAVVDAASGEELPGYGVRDTVPEENVDGLKIPLKWRRKGGATVDTSPLAGRQVQLRLYFRDGTVYAVGAG